MLFNYRVTTKDGIQQSGVIDAPSLDSAIASLQRKELIVINVEPQARPGFLERLGLGRRVKLRDVVILSRQLATLVEARVSVVAAFRLLATESASPTLGEVLVKITDDIKSGLPISDALAKHSNVFPNFYIAMVRAGEESGKLAETFRYLADYLERSYELANKVRNALIYPAFVIVSFIGVMILMLTLVIPKLAEIIKETSQDLPLYTKLVIGAADFLVAYGWLLLAAVIILAVFLWRYLKTARGQLALDHFKLKIPYLGELYQKLYLSRIADNLNTMLSSGVAVLRAIEITADVVGNQVFKDILTDAARAVKSGTAISDTLAGYEEIPPIMTQMIKVGEESGKVGYVLETLAKFYRREVDGAVDTLVGLIEPTLLVVLGLGVGLLLSAVLVPIYNIASGL